MRLTVQQVLSIPPLDRATVVAGANGLSREVKSVGVVDTPDVAKWVRGHELMLTTGYAVKDEPELLGCIVRALADRNVSGLGIKVGRFLTAIPDSVLKVADELNFPIISIPIDCAWIDIFDSIFEELVRRKNRASLIESRRLLLDDMLSGVMTSFDDTMKKASLVGIDLLKGGTLAALTSASATFPRGAGHTLYETLARVLQTAPGDPITEIESKAAFAPYGEWLAILFVRMTEQEVAETASKIMDLVQPLLPPGYGLTLGLGRTRTTFTGNVRQGFYEACKAALLGPAAIGGKPPYRYDDLGVFKVLMEPVLEHERLSFCFETIGALIRQDVNHGLSLCKTLEAFLDSGSVRGASRLLFIHYNTVKYRLSQIRKLLKLNLEDGKTRLALHLALKIWAVEQQISKGEVEKWLSMSCVDNEGPSSLTRPNKGQLSP